jgi:hypothetical protein
MDRGPLIGILIVVLGVFFYKVSCYVCSYNIIFWLLKYPPECVLNA